MNSPTTGRRLCGAQLRLVLLPLACAPDMVNARVDAEAANAPSMSPAVSEGGDTDIEFDEHMLKLRGIDPKLARYFRSAPRFTEGRHVVSLEVNGKAMGSAKARFDSRGALCIDRELLDVAEVDAELPTLRDPAASPCVDLATIYPSSKIELSPAKATVSLLVPTEALRTRRRDLSGYARGGTAALLNYEIVGLDSRWGSRTSRYRSANTELGFNAGDWVVRSRQVSTSTDGRQRMEVLDTYASRSFAEQRAVVQVGEINVVNPALSGAQITGAQVTSEQALAHQGTGATVEGIAQGPARVEVRQDGVLVYSTVVPQGPFTLTGIPRINRYSDLDVTVTGTDGEAQRFTVSGALAGALDTAPGYAIALGRLRNTGGTEAPWVLSGGWSGSFHRDMSLSAGIMAASRYHAVGLGVGATVAEDTQLNVNLAGSNATREGAKGWQGMLTLSQRLDGRWSIGLAHSRQSRGFRDLLDTTVARSVASQRSRYRDQSSASVSWSHPRLGSVSAGYSRTLLFNRRGTSRALASWASRLGRASVSLSAEWNLGRARRQQGNSVYLNVSVPLGESGRVGSSVRRYAGETRYGAHFSEQVNDYASYRAGLEYRSSDRRRSLDAGVSLLPRYAQVDGSYTRNANSTTYGIGVRGGVLWHAHGVTASPYPVRDTFGVLSAGDSAGVRISTPSGPVWTDARGYAVLPQLAPFGKSSIEVATDSLPRNVDIENGAAVVEVGRGAVAFLTFGMSKTRRVLLTAMTVDGRSLPEGATVTDEQGELVSLVQGGGQIFVPNALATPRLSVSGPDLPRCELEFRLEEQVDLGAYYESAAAVCRVVGGIGP
ncbi:fimbria/pilus outer membrane usher protein [Luteibacter sp. E-22]|uniref:fimbria/pilus outer membrane usher protein n=1 Tax=Luteibacter sp. E-22 TaxID=3404050 RepID=UPI003CF18842